MKKTLFVCAAVRILTTLRGVEQSTEARQLLGRKQWLPKALVEALEKVDQNVAATPAARGGQLRRKSTRDIFGASA